MKTYKNLYPKIYSFQNLYYAFRDARKGKRDRVAVASFEFDLERNLLKLEEELREQTYQTGHYTNFYISDPKKRLISAAPFRDRVVHHALCSIIEPIWECRFIDQSYACRDGKGTHKALDKCQQWVGDYRYVFHGDIVKYFACIDHELMYRLLARRIADKQTLWLIKQIIKGGVGVMANESPTIYFPGDDIFAMLRERGLPIGNLTSQFWANIYLHELDKFIKHELRCQAYLRYMDDFLLFANSKAQLHQWKAKITTFLATRLRLLMHPKKSHVFPVSVGVDFCGFRIYATHRRLRRTSIKRFVRRFRRLRAAYHRGELSLEEMTISVRSWIAHAKHGNTWGLRGAIFQDYPCEHPIKLMGRGGEGARGRKTLVLTDWGSLQGIG